MSDSSATAWTAAHQAPLSLGFSRQEYWSGLPLTPCLHCIFSLGPGLDPTLPKGLGPGGSSAYFLEEGVKEGRSLEAAHSMGRARTRDGHTCIWFWLCCPCSKRPTSSGETGWSPAGGVGGARKVVWVEPRSAVGGAQQLVLTRLQDAHLSLEPLGLFFHMPV